MPKSDNGSDVMTEKPTPSYEEEVGFLCEGEEKAAGSIRSFWKKHKGSIVLLAILLAALVYHQLLGDTLCPVYRILGFPCPTCGMTRAWTEALQGHLKEAFAMHPLFLLAPFLLLTLVLYEKNATDSPKRKWLQVCIIVEIVLLVCVWLYRMITIFPNQAPMTWNEEAPLRIIWRTIQGFLH